MNIEMEHVFINVKQPSDALQLAKEKNVRSHVTRRQWKNHAEANKDRKRKRREEFLPFRVELNCSALEEKRQLPSPPLSQEWSEDGSPFAQADAQGDFSFPLPMMIGGFRDDPFRSYPISWRPFLPPLVDHCKPHRPSTPIYICLGTGKDKEAN